MLISIARRTPRSSSPMVANASISLWRYIAGPVCSDGAPCMQATHRPAVATSARTVEQRLVALQGEARHTLPETVQSMEHRALRVAYFLAA